MIERQDECGSDDLRRLDVELIVAGDLTPAALRAMRHFRQAGMFCEVMRTPDGETGVVYRERWLSPAEFCALVDDQYPKAAASAATPAMALSPQIAPEIAQQVSDVLADLPPLDAAPAPQPAQPRQWLPGAPEAGQQWRAPTTPGETLPTLPIAAMPAAQAAPAVASVAAATGAVAVAKRPPSLLQQIEAAWRDVQATWARPNGMPVFRWLMETLCACALILALLVWLLFLAVQGLLR